MRSLRSSIPLVLPAAMLLAGLPDAAAALSLPTYRIVTLGDLDFVEDPGHYSYPYSLDHVTRSGYAAGLASMYDAAFDNWVGQVAWVYDPVSGASHRAGLTGFLYTRYDGQSESTVDRLAESGYAAGTSRRYGFRQDWGVSTWVYDPRTAQTHQVGLVDPLIHTRNDGYQFSQTGFLTESGQAGGISNRYLGTPGDMGASAWVYDSASAATRDVGLIDVSHTRTDGYRRSQLNGLTETGFAIGTSDRFNGSVTWGQSAWLYEPAGGTTRELGFVDPTYSLPSGYRWSEVDLVTASGLASGTSKRWERVGTSLSAWIYDAATDSIQQVGFLDAEHTSTGGNQNSRVLLLTDAGYALGQSTRYSAGIGNGASAWLYDISTSTHTRLGFSDAEHTRADGYQLSRTYRITSSGYALGNSDRYLGTAYGGSTHWIYDIATGNTQIIGFRDAEHTRDDGYRGEGFQQFTDSGYARGSSFRYNGGSADLGQTAWVYDAATAEIRAVGFVDALHTRSDGYRYSNAEFLTESGYVAGTSYFYLSGGGGGGHGWIYSIPTGSIHQIGLTDAAHTFADGTQSIDVQFLTESGLTAGWSARADYGQTAWVYDAATDQQDSIVLSTRSDGYVWSRIQALTESGLAVGYYWDFDASDNVTYRAFAWTEESGAMDLGSLVAGGLAASGWWSLGSHIDANDLDQILGIGWRIGLIDEPYLLLPAPEPGTLALLALGLAGLASSTARRRRR